MVAMVVVAAVARRGLDVAAVATEVVGDLPEPVAAHPVIAGATEHEIVAAEQLGVAGLAVTGLALAVFALVLTRQVTEQQLLVEPEVVVRPGAVTVAVMTQRQQGAGMGVEDRVADHLVVAEAAVHLVVAAGQDGLATLLAAAFAARHLDIVPTV